MTIEEQGYLRGWQGGAQGLPAMRDLGTPPAWPPEAYYRGHADGAAALRMALAKRQGGRAVVVLRDNEPQVVALSEKEAEDYVAQQDPDARWGRWLVPILNGGS